MLSLYLGSVVFGGVLLAASITGGHGDGDSHAGGHDAHGGGDNHGRGSHTLPFMSLRFWAFVTAFFGLTGAALTWAGGLGVFTPVIAAAMGFTCGGVSARVLGQLGRHEVGRVAGPSAHLGREGQVLLPIGPGRRGKVRLSIGGVSTDLVAETEGTGLLAAGETALIVGLRDTVAIVEPTPGGLPVKTSAPALAASEPSRAAPASKEEKS